jgi:hypothetical protein
VGCHGIAEVLSSVSPFKKGWESLVQRVEQKSLEWLQTYSDRGDEKKNQSLYRQSNLGRLARSQLVY